MSRPKRIVRPAALAIGFLGSLWWGAAPAQAKPVKVGNCSLSVPEAWAVSGGNASSPDGRVFVSLDRIPAGAISVAMERAVGAEVREAGTARQILKTAGAAGSTRYLAVAPPAPGPACRAQVESRAPGGDGIAAAVAATLARQ